MQILAIDIESADADQLHKYGPGFVRLCGWKTVGSSDNVSISADPARLVAAIGTADAITGHNVLNFDLIALARYHGLDYEAACLKLWDTLVVERHLDPVAARGMQANGYYRLDSLARRYGVGGKDHVDFEGKREIARRIKGDRYADRMKPGKTDSFGVLDTLKDLYDGYDQIPQDDPDYVRYLALDVEAQEAVYLAQQKRMAAEDDGSRWYARREHRVLSSLAESVTLQGMRVHTDLTMKRWAEGQSRLDASKQMMHERFGMPLEGKKPHVTNAGKAAFRAAIQATGIPDAWLDRNWKLNKDGSLATAKDVLTEKAELFEANPRGAKAAEICRTILAMNGERTIYGTVLDHLVGDRVHPYIGPDQSSGRWSMKNPGLTVFGKRGGKARERAIMLADEGEVLVAIDADQIDARMIAALSQDPEYMKLFAPGVDLHSEVAFRVWSDMRLHGPDCHQLDEWHEHSCGIRNKCHCDYRDKAKVFGHGWNYGMGPNSMARNHGVDVAVAQQFDQGMQEAFVVLCRWKEETRALAGAMPFGESAPADDSFRILHTAFGRPVRVERERAYTQACAQLGQGSTRDGMAQAILNMPAVRRRKIRAVIHDEIVVSLPVEGAQEAAQALADSMAFDFRGIRISFGCSRVSRSWAGCYGEQYEEAA